MGCGSSTGADGKIAMKKTKLPAVDEFFDDVQGFIDEVYEIQDPICDAEEKLLYHTDFQDTAGANIKHAIVGLVFNIAAQGNADAIDKVVKITDKEPFISLDGSGISGDVSAGIDCVNDYIKAVIGAKDRIQPLADKGKSFAEKAPDLPGKAKDEVGNAGGLGTMDKLRAIKNTTSNVRAVAKLPTLVNDFKDTVMGAITNIQAAVKEINNKKGKMVDIGNKCAGKNLTSSRECYQECGDPIPAGDKKAKKKAKK